MAADREARILAAGEPFQINGKSYILRPISAQHLCDLEYEALRDYKKSYLQTYIDNINLIEEGKRQPLIEMKLDEVARWDLSDLPQKDAFDVRNVPITDKVKEWVKTNCGDLPDNEKGIRALVLVSLDNGKLKADKLTELAGKGPLRGRVRYDQWWVTASMSGMVSFITTSVRAEHPEVKREDVGSWNFAKIAEAARLVESITSAAMGNT